MPKGKKAGGRDWRKGQSGNPNGRPLVPYSVKNRIDLSADLLRDEIQTMLGMTAEELGNLMKNPRTNNLQRIVGTAIAHAVAGGSEMARNFLFNRSIGQIPQAPKPELSPEELDAKPKLIIDFGDDPKKVEE